MMLWGYGDMNDIYGIYGWVYGMMDVGFMTDGDWDYVGLDYGSRVMMDGY